MTTPISPDWVARAVLATSADQLLAAGDQPVPSPTDRLDALLRAWAVGFCARRPDVMGSELRHGPRGLHPDECASFLRALDKGQLRVDSAGYVVPLCAEPKQGQQPYALCCKNDPGVTVNLEYVIQLGVLAELERRGYSRSQLQMELGSFDAGVFDAAGSPQLLMEAKARASGGGDTLERLLLKWLRYAESDPPQRGENAANKYLELLDVTRRRGSVNVLLAAAGARWWLTASLLAPGRLSFVALDA